MSSPRKGRPLVREVSIYVSEGGDELHVERADGSVTIALTGKAAISMVKQDDQGLAKRRKVDVITRVTWQPSYITTRAR